ncbi:MAG: hypothetical protein WD004_06355 [Actinomycetota bacterium]
MTGLWGPIAALVAAAVLGSIGRWLGTRAAIRSRLVRPHARPLPDIGGIVIALAMAVGLLVGSLVAPGIPGPTVAMVIVLLASLGLGLAHDRFGLPRWVRGVLVLALGTALAASGLQLGGLPSVPLEWLGTIVIFAASLTAVDMEDGLDGLATGVAFLTAFGLAVIAARGGGPEILALVLAASALGFLIVNAPPAAVFLGNNGTYLLGAGLAIVTIAIGRTVPLLLGALTCFGLLWVELLLAAIRRVTRGSPVTAGYGAHLYDQMLARGLTTYRALVVSYILQVAFVAAGVAIASVLSELAAAVFAVVWLAALGALFAGRFVSYKVGG